MRALALLLAAAAVGAAAQSSVLDAPAFAVHVVADDPWCDDGWDDARYVRVCEVVELTAPAGPLDVDGHANGSVTVRPWDGRDVRVRARIEAAADDEATARALVRRSAVGVDGGHIRAETPDVERGWVAVSLEVLTPRRTDLTADVLNGPLTIEGLEGRIEGRAVNGPVSAEGLAGDVRLRSVNGPVTVTLDGAGWRGAGLDVAAQNGPVRVAVPAGYGARLDAASDVGRVSADGLALSGVARDRGAYVGDALTATLGGGGAPLRLRSANGPVRLRAAE